MKTNVIVVYINVKNVFDNITYSILLGKILSTFYSVTEVLGRASSSPELGICVLKIFLFISIIYDLIS